MAQPRGAPEKKVPEKTSRFDRWKWLLIGVLLIAGIVADFYYSHVAKPIRAAVAIVFSVLLLLIAAQTQRGQKIWGFIKGARGELRKVFWPSRQETVQTLMVVVFVLLVAALILWGIDSSFMRAVSWMAGQRG